MSNTKKFAEKELKILSKSATADNRPIIEPFYEEILTLVDKFGDSGQSGGSAPYTANAISEAVKKLCLQKPICPITGIDEEWGEVSDGLWQNRRCSTLFKDEGGAYYLDAIVWVNDKGIGYSGSAILPLGNEEVVKIRSRQYIKGFPFEPKIFYVNINEVEVSPDNWDFYVKDVKQLDEVFEYYKKS